MPAAVAAKGEKEIQHFLAAAAERRKKFEIFQPPPSMKASAYTSNYDLLSLILSLVRHIFFYLLS